MTRVYRAFGLSIASEIDLPDLREVSSSPAAADVTISIGRLPDGLPATAGYYPLGASSLLVIDHVARYLASGGRRIEVEPAPGVAGRNLRLFLLGSAMGMLLHQRGLLPLHANAVVIDGRAFAFTGPSGSGKSTLAAWFQDHGFPLLSDDVCVIGFDLEGRAVAFPGLPRLRLWRDAIERSGRQVGDFQRSFEEEDTSWDKYDVPAREQADLGPIPLGGIFLLAEGPASRVEPLGPVEALQTVFGNIYRGEYLAEGQNEAVWRACLEVVRQVPVARWSRSKNLDRFEPEVRELLDSIRSSGR